MTNVASDVDIEYVYDKDVPGQALVWVIDGDCVYDAPVQLQYAEIFLTATEADEVSSEYPDHDGMVIRLSVNGEPLLDFKTTEYFGNVLLSDPQVLKLNEYPYGRYVDSPNASFDGEKFIITNRNVIGLPEFFETNNNS